MKSTRTVTLLILALTLASCRGMTSDSPPIHPNRNMDFQNRFDAQEANPLFDDNRSMRPPVPGTVARGMLREDTQFYTGREENGALVERMPIPTTREVLLRGQERFDVFCAPCHGRTGDGEGIITAGGFGYTPAPTFHIDRLRQESDGYLYNVIANGIRTMPPYGHQVTPADRWAIVGYIRALQRSQQAGEEDVPASIRAEANRAAPAPGGAGSEAAAPQEADTAGAQEENANGGEGARSRNAGSESE